MESNLTESEINKIVSTYLHRKQYSNEYVKRKYATDESFRNKRLNYSSTWYTKNVDKKKEYYDNNKERINAISKWKYATRKNTQDKFKKKYPELYNKYIVIS